MSPAHLDSKYSCILFWDK